MEDIAGRRSAPVGARIVVPARDPVNPGAHAGRHAGWPSDPSGTVNIVPRGMPSTGTGCNAVSSLVASMLQAICMSMLRSPLRWLLLACTALILSACQSQPNWQLNNVQGHLPDLKFSLTNDLGQPVTAQTYRGKVVLLYFGYTHCPDVCPLTLVHLHTVLQKLDKDAENVRVLFVTVDPIRDTVPVLHQYVQAFDPRIVGLTGTQDAIATLAKRYRAFYKPETPDTKSGDYEVTHSSATYIFDRDGRAQLLATPGSTNDELYHDLKTLVEQGS
jgi:protein SCO1/2